MIPGVSHSQCTAVTNDCETHAGRFASSYRQKVIREDVLLRGARFFITCDLKDTLFVSWDDLPRHEANQGAEAQLDPAATISRGSSRAMVSMSAGVPSRHKSTAKQPGRSSTIMG
jgi:hypothetical protein